MDKEAFNEALRALGAGQTALARALGVNPRTVRRWALGEAPAPPYAVLVLTLLHMVRECCGPDAVAALLEKKKAPRR